MPSLSRRLVGNKAAALITAALLGMVFHAERLRAGEGQKNLQLEIVINSVPARMIGSFIRFDDGRIGGTIEELESIGLRSAQPHRPDDIIALDDIPTLKYEYEERTQRILITVDDIGRKPQSFDVRGNANSGLVQAQAGYGTVLNYDLLSSTSSFRSLRSLSLASSSVSLNARMFSPYGTAEQSAIVRAGPQQPTEVIRLNSSYRYSDPERMISYVAGDTINGGLAMTRHELSAPLDFGPFNLVPYAWGEAAGWSNSFTGNSIDRLVGSVGVRGSIQFAKYMPWVQSRIFDLNGLAHKMVFDFDWSLTEANRSLSSIPQWNEFDDNSQERFRQRLLTNTFGGTLPPQFDPRNFAVRTGAGSSVTAPWHELVDDLHVVRLGWRNRWQTKVGPLERQRVKDWMTLDLEMSLFPNSTRDNFGDTAGLLGARYAWHVGERTSLLANGLVDPFNGGMELWNVGVLNQRSTRGSLYAGIRQVKGQGLNSQILTFSSSYAMSDKWIGTAGTAYDLAEHRNRGQSFTLTRVGADFLFHFGANFDASKNNAGLAISVEPRLGGAFNSQNTQLSNLMGIR